MAPFALDAVRAMPKAELHVHLEGTVDSATFAELAERHGIELPAADIDGWYRFAGDFDGFLLRYHRVLELFRTPADFALVAERYLDLAHEQGVVHVEFHVSACGHMVEGGQRWEEIHGGVVDGCRAAEHKTGISWALIPDISPHLPAAACAKAIGEVLAGPLDGVVAIGMGGPADTWQTDDFAPIFAAAKDAGLRRVSHAGEHGGAWEVGFAIREFGAERIQHGIGAMKDRSVVALLVERGIPCDVAPGSNLALGAVAGPADHPLAAMLDAGVVVTLGSDDPPMCQSRLLDEYQRAWEWCDLGIDGMRDLAANSLRSSFAAPSRIQAWLSQLAALG